MYISLDRTHAYNKEVQIGLGQSMSKKGQDGAIKCNEKFIRLIATKEKIQSYLDDLASKGDYLCVDEMKTPAHAPFENDNDYQLVLSDVF